MTFEELAFVNQQLAGMLRAGIPLEGALRQLCADMQQGTLRQELTALEGDLAKGLPFKSALATRKLPAFYVQMLQLGAQTNDLPGVLTLVADYYQRASLVSTRLKGLMVYPAIVLVASLGLSIFLGFVCTSLIVEVSGTFEDLSPGRLGVAMPGVFLGIWLPSLLIALTALVITFIMSVPSIRRGLRWRLPGFREGSLTNFAATMSLMLRNGGNLNQALELSQALEGRSPAGAEILRWKQRLGEGRAKFADLSAGSKVFPPLFLWLVAQGGEDLAAGFKKAADIYYARAVYRVELLLYAALPVTVLILGVFILTQFYPLLRAMTFSIDSLGDSGG